MYIQCPSPNRADANNNMDQPIVWDQNYKAACICIWKADADAKEYFYKYFVFWIFFVEIILAHVLTANLRHHHNNALMHRAVAG